MRYKLGTRTHYYAENTRWKGQGKKKKTTTTKTRKKQKESRGRLEVHGVQNECVLKYHPPFLQNEKVSLWTSKRPVLLAAFVAASIRCEGPQRYSPSVSLPCAGADGDARSGSRSTALTILLRRFSQFIRSWWLVFSSVEFAGLGLEAFADGL